MLLCKNIPTIIPFHSVSKQCIEHVLICHAIIMMLFSHTGEFQKVVRLDIYYNKRLLILPLPINVQT